MYDDDLTIFNDAYFDNDNYDIDPANESLGGWLLASFGVFATLLIKTIIRSSKKASRSHATIISVNKMIVNGMTRAEATAEAKKSIEWMRRKGYTSVDSDAQILTYSDLTPDGQKFIDGYFEYIGKIDDFSIKKSLEKNKSKLATLERVADNASAILNLIIMIFYVGPSAGGLIFLPFTVAKCFWAGTDLVKSIQRIIKKVQYNDRKPDASDAIECAVNDMYENGYHQALIDIGVEFDDAVENNNIFNDDYFDIANEGYFADKKEEQIERDKQDILARKDSIKSMKPNEKNKAWTGMIRTLKIKGYLPSAISPNSESISRYDLFNSSILSRMGHGEMYTTGVRLLNRVIHEEFTNSSDAVDYLKELIMHDQEQRAKREEVRKEAFDRIERQRMLNAQYQMINKMK